MIGATPQGVSRLREARENAGLSRSQAARQLDMTQSALSAIEDEARQIPHVELVRFANLYRVSTEWLSGQDAADKVAPDEQIRLAARELSRMKQSDLHRVLEILSSAAPPKGNAAR